jgi:hypothetical protein
MKRFLQVALLLLATPILARPQDVSFKLLGGLTGVQGDDYNTCIASTWQLLHDTATAVTGNYQPFKNALNLQAEIITHWGKHIAVGLGGGYFQISHNDLVASQTATADGSTATNTTIQPNLSVIPFFLNVYYKFEIAPRIGLHIFAGPAFQIAQFSYTRQTTSTSNSLNEVETFKAASPSLGYQGGVSLTVRISRGLAFAVDGIYRHGTATNFSGNWLLSSTSTSEPVNSSSSTYSFWTYDYKKGTTYHLFGFSDTPGPSGDGISGVRKASLDLSGFTLVAGVKLDF